MRKSINLALGRKQVDTLLKKIFYATVAAFFVCVVLSLSLIVYRLVLKGSFDALEAREQQLNQQLLEQVDKRDKIVETKTRLTEIKKIIASRSPVTARIGTVSEMIPAESLVTGITGADKRIEISLESENLASLNDLLELKIQELTQDKKRGIKKIEMLSFGLNPKTLRYGISVGIEFI